ncbi:MULTISPECIES: transposase [unclassified Acinetobacter]|uniref:transposase n=1 Tax=unclassified Acinetobacter TaxID=196816 RepID=UPI002934AC31|nr:MULTISPECIES: transposase [unclassified Acinetobacter]WOE33059.1 hypothetical protein QSG84_02430 [Acinetobacter sp. SAAs470]WOE39890.1 hypothetical protein QSG86_11475 [Acinetobacter sp. SAAs474]
MNANRNPIEFIIVNRTPHDMKVTPDLINALDLKETEILRADKSFDSKRLREKIRNTQTGTNITKKLNTQSSKLYIDRYLFKKSTTIRTQLL